MYTELLVWGENEKACYWETGDNLGAQILYHMGEKKNGKHWQPRYSKEHRRESDLTEGDGRETQDTHESKWEEIPQAPSSVEAAKTLTFKV